MAKIINTTSAATIPTAAEMVVKLKIAMRDNPIGVITVVVDGQTVTYSRSEAMAELAEWETRALKEAGGRPRFARIKLG